MGKKKAVSAKSPNPRSFGGLLRGHARDVKAIAKALREVVLEELPDVRETFYGGKQAMAMYRTSAEICWIQPLKERCNLYFMLGTQLTDDDQILEGTSNKLHVKIRSLDDIENYPVRSWIRQTVALIEAAANEGISFDDTHQKLQSFCLTLLNTKETLTWGRPHFRVGEKIFCNCWEDQGRPEIGLKMELYESRQMMKLPGIDKAPYSRKDDGWVKIDPRVFDDWEEIERFIVDSYRLVAPKRTL